ncbi:hypothetical protein SUGI_1164500 [Cryptomeria japonica]|nr:hypothetical protein SUGI_1164500 [Cryptomeria japonica]
MSKYQYLNPSGSVNLSSGCFLNDSENKMIEAGLHEVKTQRSEDGECNCKGWTINEIKLIQLQCGRMMKQQIWI